MQTVSYKPCYLFVEGDTDRLFMERAFYKSVARRPKVFDYAQKISKAKKLIGVIKHQPSKYVFTHDSDGKTNLVRLKAEIESKFALGNTDCISIVVVEIESWLVAGMPESKRVLLKPGSLTRSKWSKPESIDKEFFKEIASRNGLGKLAFVQQCIEEFDYRCALSRSPSFEQFAKLFNAIFV